MAYLFTSASSQAIHNASASPVTAFPITISAWVKCTTLVGVAVCISNGAGLINLSINSSGQANVLTRDDTQVQQFNATTSTTAATTGTWNHIAAVCASTSSRIAYLNGVASTANTSVITNSIAAYNRISIGSRFVASRDSFFNGDIAEVGVWNVALNADEIASLAKGFPCRFARPSSLQFYSRLIRNIMDIRNGLALTNTNGATVSDHPRIIYPC